MKRGSEKRLSRLQLDLTEYLYQPTMKQQLLSNATLGQLNDRVAVPAYDRNRLTAGIAHIGVGNFHRVHQALYVDRCLHLPGHEAWAICGIGLGSSTSALAKVRALHAQDCLYTVTEFDSDGSASTRVIGAMIDYLHAPADPEAVLRELAGPAIRIVSLTITEGGYNFDEATGEFKFHEPDVAHDLAGAPPRTAFGFIVEALRRRREANVPAFTVMSCDNLRQSGNTVRRAVLSFAQAVDPGLADWIADNATFPNGMVDRIAPQVTPEVRAKVAIMSGIDDATPVVAETFTQWVIEDRFSNGRPAFDAVGVEVKSDVSAYEAMKGRMLNASHMLLAYPAILLGYRFVHEAMSDPDIAALLGAFFQHDVSPILELPPGVSSEIYEEKVLERFGNPAVADQLLRVAHDGAAKIPVFHAKTIDTLVHDKRDMRREALLLACFQEYLRGVDDRGEIFTVDEKKLTAADWELHKSSDPLAVLNMSSFSSLRLAEKRAFVEPFCLLQGIVSRGDTRMALREAR
ncbi:mannitol dehydrogenase family protein [Paraburkholderia youngii]|uniref:mannitol dehydrogenase family protein n=1 Tax=Paraburkholderia youngii TaxID=2782701 RepID=UPI003D2575D7